MAKDRETFPRVAPEITEMRRTYRPTAPTIDLAMETNEPVLDSKQDSLSKAANRITALKRTVHSASLDDQIFISYVHEKDNAVWLVYAQRRQP